jgi:hypothetical protein
MTDKGTYIANRPMKFGDERLAFIEQLNAVIEEYAAQGLDMTIRQLYYQMVSRFPEQCPNNDKFYNKLQSAINDGRLAGIVSWTAIEDRTRTLMGTNTVASPEQAIKDVAADYKRDLWAGQPWRPMVVVEKEAQIGNIAGICNKLRIDFYASRGYNSQSEMWRAGRRAADDVRKGQRPIIFDLRDHDPSGVNMTDDYRARLEMFAGTPIMVQRLALNMDQVIALRPPPNPAKRSDGRVEAYEDYMEEIGHGDLKHLSWELDALSPTFIRDLIEGAVMKLRDERIWDNNLEKEVEDIRRLETFAEGF